MDEDRTYGWCIVFYFYIFQSDAHSSAIFTAEEEIFAFERTISRLTEMQTEQYWNWQGFRKSWDVFGSWHRAHFLAKLNVILTFDRIVWVMYLICRKEVYRPFSPISLLEV